jgi:hypothetical protein
LALSVSLRDAKNHAHGPQDFDHLCKTTFAIIGGKADMPVERRNFSV